MQETECMFINTRPTLRARVREALYRIESRRPGTLLRILEFVDEVLENEAVNLKPEALGSCSKCGEPTSPYRNLCKLCEILAKAGILEPVYATGFQQRRD
jgi:uncharacterized protein (TIGR00269 family)